MNGTPFAAAVPNLAGMAMLVLGLLLPTRRRREAAARLVAWQGGLLALAAAAVAWSGTSASAPLLWPLAIGALAGRALLLPALLRLATEPGGNAPSPRAGRATAARPAPVLAGPLLAGGGLAVLAVAAVVPAGAGVASGTREGMALALAVLLAGMLAMLLRRGLAFGLLGLLAAENGALLGLVHAGGGGGAPLHGTAALAVLSPGLLACVALAARSKAFRSLIWVGRR